MPFSPVTLSRPAPRVVTAGEALIDLVAQHDGLLQPCLGGAVFNLSRALARQNVPTLYLNPLSSDRFGQQLAHALVADGVQVAQAGPVPQPTSLAVVAVNEQGHPDYAFYRAGVADRAITARHLNEMCQAQPQLAVACTGCLALDPDDAAIYLPWLQAQKAAGKWRVVDVNLRPSVMPDLARYRAHVMAMAQLADVLKASDEDLAHLQVEGAPVGDPMAQAMCLMKQTSAQWMALTLGAEGACLLVRRGKDIKVFKAREAAAVQVVDTVGAGDSFLAGLLACALHHADRASSTASDSRLTLHQWADSAPALVLQDVLAHALASATLVVMRRGCVPAHWAEVRARLSANPLLS